LERISAAIQAELGFGLPASKAICRTAHSASSRPAIMLGERAALMFRNAGRNLQVYRSAMPIAEPFGSTGFGHAHFKQRSGR
jgi:hypothetical protein